MPHIGFLVAFACALSSVPAWPAEDEDQSERKIVIITHPDNEFSELTKSELGRMFLKTRTAWTRGERCIPIDQSGSSEIRQQFYQIVLDKTVYDMKRYWMQETMTGNARPPVSLQNSVTVKKYVGKLEGGIAYIYEDELDDSVKAIHVVDVPEFYSPKDREANGDDAPESEAP